MKPYYFGLPEPFKPDMRVKLSAEGIAAGYAHGKEQRFGTIVGSSNGGHALRVVWDGSKWPSPYHASFLTPAEEGASA